MRKRIVLIGPDSFIARNFISGREELFDISGVTLTPSPLNNELVVDDLWSVNAGYFEGAEAVVNFAAIVHRPEIRDQRIYHRVNHQLPLQLARSAAEAGVRHFVQMSTVAVYGKAERISPETPCAPDSPYGASKLMADRDLLDMRAGGFNVTVVRPSMVYGSGAAPGNMMKLIRLCDLPVPLPFHGIGNSRQFAYTGLVTEALERIITGEEGGTLLVADRDPVSTGQLAETIRSALGRRRMLFRLPGPARSILSKVRPALYDKLFGSLLIDVEDTFRRLGLSGRSDMEKGIREMVSAYRSG
jgi:UDP-glucose 4-epimerase